MKKRIAIYPGTFDPITCGHLDIIERATKLFDQVIVTIAINSKKNTLFSLNERLDMIKMTTNHINNISIESFSGLLIDFASKKNAVAIIRGLRAVSDFEFEFQMALMNYNLNQAITTVFLMPNEKYTYLNSTIVKEVAEFGGEIDNLVPACVVTKLRQKLNK